MKRFITFFTIITLMAGSSFSAVSKKISFIKLQKMSKQQYFAMQKLGLDIVEMKGEEFKVFAKPEDLTKLQSLDIKYEIIHPDIKAFYLSRNTESASMGGFRTYSEIVAYLDSLTAAYPNITTDKFSIGNSIEGRPQWVVKISDNPDIDEDEPEVFYISLIHAREPAAAAALLNYMDYLLSNYGVDQEVTDIVNNRELYFLPVQNPDGYVYNETTDPLGGGMWRKNRRDNGDGNFGVDLNRNYGFKWGYDDLGSSPNTSYETYRGTGPFSEPETQNVKNFIISRNFKIIHNFHTYSNLEIWPYGYDRFYTTEEDFFENLGDSLTKLNNYTPEIGWSLYPTNGDADDWAWGDTISKPRTISLTCEIGSSSDGFWPDPSRIPTLEAENIWPNLFLAKIADNPFRIAPPKTPTIFSPDSSDSNYSIEWSVDDTINTPASYKLIEYTDKQQMIDDAESDHGYWQTVRMSLSNSRSHSGNYSWHTISANRSHHWLISNIPYEVQPDDSLKFWIWYAIENGWDYFYTQVSTDGGYTFENLANNLTTTNNPHGQNLGNGITGLSTGWVEAKFDLSPYVGQQVIFRLAYYTDDYSLEEGVYIDDIENVNIFQNQTEISSSIVDTFYNFTGKPNGQYWYRVTAIDNDDQESRLSPFTFIKVVTPSYVLGDANGDGQVNGNDLLFLINYCFAGGPAPNPLEVADVDCNGSVNGNDILFMINYMFEGGPAPNCP